MEDRKSVPIVVQVAAMALVAGRPVSSSPGQPERRSGATLGVNDGADGTLGLYFAQCRGEDTDGATSSSSVIICGRRSSLFVAGPVGSIKGVMRGQRVPPR